MFVRTGPTYAQLVSLTPAQNFALVALLAGDEYDFCASIRASDKTDVSRPWCMTIHSRCSAALVKLGLAQEYVSGERYDSYAIVTDLGRAALKHTPELRTSVDVWVKTLTKAAADAKAERETPEYKAMIAGTEAWAAMTPEERRSQATASRAVVSRACLHSSCPGAGCVGPRPVYDDEVLGEEGDL